MPCRALVHMNFGTVASFVLAAGVAALPTIVQAQRMPYGAGITLEQARKTVAAAQTEQRKMNMPTGVAIAVLDSGCNLVLLERLDNTNLGGIQIAQDKAYAACAFRLNTKGAQDRLTKGGDGMILLQLHRMVAVEGGEPIIADGKTIGAIGVSGGSSEQDAQIAKAGAEAIK